MVYPPPPLNNIKNYFTPILLGLTYFQGMIGLKQNELKKVLSYLRLDYIRHFWDFFA